MRTPEERRAPEVVISNPGAPKRAGDVLSSGREESPGRRGLVAGAGVMVMIAIAALLAGSRGSPSPAPTEATAREISAALTGVNAGEAGTFSVLIGVERAGGTSLTSEQVAELRVEGVGLSSLPSPDTELSGSAQLERSQLAVNARVACSSVAGGSIPAGVSVHIGIRRGAKVRVERVPIEDAELRRTVLESCGLPDPLVRTRVETSSYAGSLLLHITPTERGGEVVIDQVQILGWRVQPVGITFPYVVEAGGMLITELEVAVADCAVAARQTPVLQVAGRDHQGVFELEAAAIALPTPEEGTSGYLLAQRLREACP